MNCPDCMYCNPGERLDQLMIYICDLSICKAYLFRDQTHYGRCVVACNKHVKEMYDLPPEEINLYANDIALVAKAIAEVVSPVKINYGMYGDKMIHLHCHVVPKQENAPDFGGTFQMSYQPPKHLSETENQALITKLKAKIKKFRSEQG